MFSHLPPARPPTLNRLQDLSGEWRTIVSKERDVQNEKSPHQTEKIKDQVKCQLRKLCHNTDELKSSIDVSNRNLKIQEE